MELFFKTYDAMMQAVEKLLASGKRICTYRPANELDGTTGWILFL